MKRLSLVSFLTMILLSFPFAKVNAQYTIQLSQPKISELKPINQLRSTSIRQKILVLDELPKNELRAVKLNEEPSEFRVFRFAVNRPLNIDLKQVGEWFIDEGGHYVWAFSIKSPKAYSTSVLFEDYDLSEGAKLFVYGKGQSRGALTELNNSPSKILQLAPVEGEQINFLYVADKGDKSMNLPFRISRLSHGFVDLRSMAAKERFGCDEGEPYYNLWFNTLEKLACADNVIKHEKEDLQARSVVLLVTDGSLMSSAALINNTRNDGTPYVLTASHCVNGVFDYPDDLERVKKSVASAVFFFGFESPAPHLNIRGSEEKTISGAELVAYNTEADMALLKLTGLPKDQSGKAFIPDAYNPYFAGWNTSPNPKGPFFNIHHPVATTKRFNLSKDTTIKIIDYSLKNLSFIQKHWLISEWEIGTTDGGSSGSPLFDDQGLVIGALSGGVSQCGSAYNDKYFAICNTWEGDDAKASLQPWLDPDNSLVESCQGLDPNKNEKLYRLSEFYGKESRFDTFDGDDNALGRVIDIEGDGEMEILGSYFVFKGNKELQQNFPEHVIELYPLSKGKTGEALWSSPVTMPLYNYYSEDKKDFTTNSRTFFADTVEVFVPKTGIKIKAGKYLLCLKRKEEGKALSIPLLKTTKDSKTTSVSFHSKLPNQWRYVQNEGLWLDLLLKSAKPVTTAVQVKDLSDSLAYYSESRLYLDLSAEDSEANLRLYDVEGRLYLEKEPLSAGQSVIELTHLPRNKVYLAVLNINGKMQVLKFLHK